MSENVKKANTNENTESKAKISEKNLAIIITAAILAVIAIATAVVFVVQAIKNDSGFNYLKSDLDKYIEFPADYKNFTIELDIAKPKDIDVDIALLQLLAAEKTGNGNKKNLDIWSGPIGAGDQVSIYYRGYILDSDGEKIAVDGMSNFGDANPYNLVIGSGSFVPGFEYSLVGVSTDASNRFSKITSGKPTENQVVYVSYTRIDGNDSTKNVTVTNERIDLSDEGLESTYGANFKKAIMGVDIGTKVELIAPDDGSSYGYSNLTVSYATECEDKFILVECYFPYSYSKEDLRNETAYFEVYVNGFVDYEATELDEIDDEFIKEKLDANAFNVTEETLNTYEGSTLVEKYYAYAKETLMKNYEAEYDELLRDKILEYYREKSKSLKYPLSKVEEIYQEYYDTVNSSYISNEGQLTNSYGSTSTYQTLDTYAVAYLGLTSGADWKAEIRSMAEKNVKERMILYYLVRNEGLIPSEAEFAAEVEATKARIIDEYIKQYLAYEGSTKDDYDDYDAFVADRTAEVYGYYDNEYFEESTYLELLMREAVEWPEVITLDERRAYPVNQ